MLRYMLTQNQDPTELELRRLERQYRAVTAALSIALNEHAELGDNSLGKSRRREQLAQRCSELHRRRDQLRQRLTLLEL